MGRGSSIIPVTVDGGRSDFLSCSIIYKLCHQRVVRKRKRLRGFKMNGVSMVGEKRTGRGVWNHASSTYLYGTASHLEFVYASGTQVVSLTSKTCPPIPSPLQPRGQQIKFAT
jgi:hypothetical protein